MNIKILHKWLTEYLVTNAKSSDIEYYLTLSGPSIEKTEIYKGDKLYDIEITTNRIDMASVLGIAREARAILSWNGFKAQIKPLKLAKPEFTDKLKLKIKDPNHFCKRLMAVVMDNASVGVSPEFIQNRLRAANIRPLNSLIDVTNYVMLEVGYPTHVFDYDRIKTKQLLVRNAKDGECFISLDNKKYILTKKDIIIDDGTGRIIDLPGIMGAANSAVTNKTKRIIFFSQANDPVKIRQTAMRLGIQTVAASYNENLPDKQLIKTALLRGMYLFNKYSGAKQASALIDINSSLAVKKTISITLAEIEKHIGITIKPKEIIEILNSLEFSLKKNSGHNFQFTVPSHRQEDIKIKEDLIEEIARIYGYEKIPEELPPFSFITDKFIHHSEDLFFLENKIKDCLANFGFYEVCNYSMISSDENKLFGLPQNSIQMNNPMSKDLLVFKQSLIPSLAKNALTNLNHKTVNLFEIANIYLPNKDKLPSEEKTIGILVKQDFSALKGYLEGLFQSLNINLLKTRFKYPEKSSAYLDQNQSAEIFINKEKAGYLGVLSKSMSYSLGLKKTYTVAELSLEMLLSKFVISKTIKPINSLMPIIEDLTYLQNKSISWHTITQTIVSQFSEVKKIELIACYKQYITMRLYSYPLKHQSILKQIIAYLENHLGLKIKQK